MFLFARLHVGTEQYSEQNRERVNIESKGREIPVLLFFFLVFLLAIIII